jgi:hypothetical protein
MNMGLVIALVVLGAAVLAIGWIRSHPKPAEEALPDYVEDVASGVGEEVVAEVKKVTRRRKASGDTAVPPAQP